jgi:hypothetical protein
MVPLEPGPEGRRIPRPLIVERTRDAALAAIHRVDPQIRETIRRLRQQDDPRLAAAYPADEAEIYPTKLGLAIVTIPGATNARAIHMWTENNDIGY